MTKKEDTPEYTIHYHYVVNEPVETDEYSDADISQRRYRRPYYPPTYRRPYYPPRRGRYYPPRYGYGCPAGSTAYYARYGDTPWTIAQQFGIDVDDLLSANPGLETGSIDVGERVCIPR